MASYHQFLKAHFIVQQADAKEAPEEEVGT